MGSPILILRIGHAFLVQPLHHPVQPPAPEVPEQLRAAEAADKRRTEGVIDAHERTPRRGPFQGIVTKAAQRPDLRAVVGTVDAGGDIAAAGIVGIGVAAAEKIRIARPGFVAVAVIVGVTAAEQVFIGAADLVVFRVIIRVPGAEKIRLAGADFVALGIVGRISAAEEVRFTAADLVPFFVVVCVAAAEQIRLGMSLVGQKNHSLSSGFSS